jgi:purine-binding chemotaxis protein CheW
MNEQHTDETIAAKGTEDDGTLQEVMERMIDLDWAILEQRARELAGMTDTEVDAGEMIEVLTFYLGHETYAVEVRHVHQVRPLDRLTPVPCTPSFVVGVVNLQGEILSLLDFRRFLGIQQEGITDLMEIIVIEAAGLKVGLMAKRVDEVSRLPLAHFKEPPATINEAGAGFVKGVTPDGCILLDMEAILGNERIIVNESVA